MSIKKIDLKAEHKYVSLSDDAIDVEKSDLESYAKDFNIKHLIFHPEAKPTFFILKNLSAEQYAELIGSFMKFDMKSQTLSMKEDGNIMAMAFKSFELGCKELEEGGERISVHYNELPMNVVQEVSNVITALAQLSEAEKK